MVDVNKIIDLFGGQTALAKMINKAQSTVAYWVKAGTIPAKWHPVLLELSKQNGLSLKATDFVMMSSEIAPQNAEDKQVFAKHKGELSLGNSTVDCYVLNTGQRVISMRASVKAIANEDSGNLGSYIGIEGLKGLIDKDKILGEIIAFDLPGTQMTGNGLTAEVFLDICRAYVDALQANSLKTNRQKEVAVNCSVLLASCAKVGLIALIDEATGHQYVREDEALQIKLKAFISEELRAWEKTFPDELWEEFGRLTNWQGTLHNRPKWWGKLVIELIYDTLDPEIAEYIKSNKPPAGIHWHRQLTENIGARQLVSRCYEVIGMAKTCVSMRELRDKVAEHYGRHPVQFTLYLPYSRD